MWWVAPLGLIIGITLGALGGGGAILTVPILVYLLGQQPSAATAGSLIIVGLTALVGMIPHQRAGRVRLAEGAIFGALGTVGAMVGSAASARVPPHVLMVSFAVLLVLVAILMARRGLRQRHAVQQAAGSQPPAQRAALLQFRPFRLDTSQLLPVFLTASGVGLLTGFFGVGGGFAVVPALVLALGFSMPMAVGTSLLVISINSAVALASRLGSGVHIDWPLILSFSLLAATGSLLGGRVAQKVSPQLLNLAFTILLFAVAGYVAIQNVPYLIS